MNTKNYRTAISEVYINTQYYDSVDTKTNLLPFWHEESPFRTLFNWLDLTNVVELACGHGRHVNQYCDTAKNIILVDILQENIDYVKNRFKDKTNIKYYKNNGCDLSELEQESISSLFCYDSMVHFEFLDVIEYLKEIHRILEPGKFALLHHSNYLGAPGADSHRNPAHRNFMSSQIFYHVASRIGFNILKQQLIDWDNIGCLDGITLLEKQKN